MEGCRVPVIMQLLTDTYLETYKQQLTIDLPAAVAQVQAKDMDARSFTFYTSVAVMSSSKIEGERLEVDSYVKHKMQDIEYLPELTEKPNDLFLAYQYARKNKLSKKHFLESHTILSQHLLSARSRGKYRTGEMLVLEHNTGRIQYEAASAAIVSEEMEKLWQDIELIRQSELSLAETFYYASFVHLMFVAIHPFNDGNGRAGRLLEKWLLAEKLGDTAWYIQSEKYYYHYVNDYYRNLARVGMFYERLDFSKADRFLQMLPNAVNYQQ